MRPDAFSADVLTVSARGLAGVEQGVVAADAVTGGGLQDEGGRVADGEGLVQGEFGVTGIDVEVIGIGGRDVDAGDGLGCADEDFGGEGLAVAAAEVTVEEEVRVTGGQRSEAGVVGEGGA